MNKFSEGDMIMRTRGGNQHLLAYRSIHIVNALRDGNVSLVDEKVGGRQWDADNFDLVTRQHKEHAHADVIRAFARGAPIEYQAASYDIWTFVNSPSFYVGYNYRVMMPVPVETQEQKSIRRIRKTIEQQTALLKKLEEKV